MVLKQGFKYAQEENLVTFGVIPNRAETGYGYIESKSSLNINNMEGSKINRFIEKPNEELAKKLIQSKRYTWNSGMFAFKTKTILEELRQHAPLVMNQCGKAMKKVIKIRFYKD